jgi:hypothetical protein
MEPPTESLQSMVVNGEAWCECVCVWGGGGKQRCGETGNIGGRAREKVEPY